MSATTVSVPKYRRHKGSGQAFVQIKGHHHYLGKWDSPKSKEWYCAFVAELATRPSLPPAIPHGDTQITVIELCAAYWGFAQGYYTKNGKPVTFGPLAGTAGRGFQSRDRLTKDASQLRADHAFGGGRTQEPGHTAETACPSVA